MFDDTLSERKNLPNQGLDVVDVLQRAPDLDSFRLYANQGFLWA